MYFLLQHLHLHLLLQHLLLLLVVGGVEGGEQGGPDGQAAYREVSLHLWLGRCTLLQVAALVALELPLLTQEGREEVGGLLLDHPGDLLQLYRCPHTTPHHKQHQHVWL